MAARSPYSRNDYEGAAVETTLASGLSAGATSATLDDSTGWPDGSAGHFFVVVTDGADTVLEKIDVTSRSGVTLTLGARGVDGTSDTTHAAGRTIFPVFTAVEADEANYTVAETVGKVTGAGQVLIGDGANSLAALDVKGDGKILVGNGTTATSVAVSGDISLTNAGVTAIGAGKVTAAMMSDAELAAIGGLTSAADKVPYFTGSGTAAVADFTAAGRALVDDADAAAQRTTLGLGTMSTQAASAVAVTGGTVTGITDLAIADGGTAASTAAGARTNLGLVIGTDIPAGPLGTVGYASVTASQTGITDSGSDLTSLTITFTAVAGRRYRITGFVGSFLYVSGTQTHAGLNLRNGAGTDLAQSVQGLSSTNIRWGGAMVQYIIVPGAGSVTYKLWATAFGTGTPTMTMVAGAAQPAFVLAEDIGT